MQRANKWISPNHGGKATGSESGYTETHKKDNNSNQETNGGQNAMEMHF